VNFTEEVIMKQVFLTLVVIEIICFTLCGCSNFKDIKLKGGLDFDNHQVKEHVEIEGEF
jgi:predicted small lipoprotein YifL